MAGFLSGVFHTVNVQGADSGTQTSEQSYEAGVRDELDHQQSVSVSHSESVTYEAANGSTHSWSNGQDVALTVGDDATLGAAADVTAASMSKDDF